MLFRRAALAAVILLLGLAVFLGGLIAFGTSAPPPTMTSITGPASQQSFADLPPAQTYAARDGTALTYRRYAGREDAAMILIHGSTGSAAAMHSMSRGLAAENGPTIYALDMRGHGASGRLGDIDYIGQMEADLADFLLAVPKQAKLSLLGFSSGGGFALRIAGTDLGQRFEPIILVSPMLHPQSPTYRQSGGWASVHLPRLIALAVLDGFGLPLFQQLPVLAFARQDKDGRPYTYSFRLWANFKPHENYAADYRRQAKAPILLIGEQDELFNANAYEPELKAIRPDARVRLLPGLNHMGASIDASAIAAIREELRNF